MRASFLLAFRQLLRGRVLLLVLSGIGLVHWLLPRFVRSDGTGAGMLEMYIRAVPGVAITIVLLTILSVAAGLFAHEREEKRLALTLVRPTSAFSVAAGKYLALVVVAALALAFSGGLVGLFAPMALPPCRHHYAPSLPPAEIVAGHLLADYLADPATPEAVRSASKSAVLTLLTTKEVDRYEVVKPGAEMIWPFEIPALREKMAAGADLTLRVRFSTQFEMRTPVAGRFWLGDYSAVVSNNTQAVLDIPLRREGSSTVPEKELCLHFANVGKSAVMVRPRRDLEVLVPADAFAANLFRAELEALALAALLAAYGLFLSSALSRPVAIFTALVTLAIVLMVPSVIAQFPDEFNAPLADRLGLALSRGVQFVTASVSTPAPVSDLATGRAIEWGPLLSTLFVNMFAWPVVLLSLAAFISRRKPLGDAD